MRTLVLAAVLLVACHAHPPDDGEGMPQTVTVRARGLYTQPSEAGGVPDGALARADNVIISRDNQIETRRGMEIVSARALAKLFPWKGVFLGHDGASTLARSDAGAAAWTDYGAAIAPPAGERLRFAVANGNAYLTASGGPLRIDALTGTPERHGMPDALDAQGVGLQAVGSAIPGNSQVGYRVLFGKIDANGNTILGAPSSRAVVASAQVTIAIGSLVRSGTTVTATLSGGASSPFAVGDILTLSPGEANFAIGNKTITGSSGSTFTYTEAGSAVASTAAQTFTYTARDVSVSFALPQGLPAGSFVQGYRTPASVTGTTDPGDEEGLVYQGPVPLPQALTQLARAGSTVTAMTAQAHGYSAGMTLRLPVSVTTPGGFIAIGINVAANSPDGTTWSARTIPAGVYYAAAWNGTVYAAVGASVAATSPDGVTWTARTIPAGTYRAIVWTGVQFVAVGDFGVASTSPDGTTWTARTTGVSTSFDAVAWNGSVLVAAGAGTFSVVTSPDGVTWTGRTAPANLSGVAWNGSVFAVVGQGSAATSPDGITWTNRTRSWPAATCGPVAWNGAVFALVGEGAGGYAATSPDGITWTNRAIPGGLWTSIAWGSSVFVAVGLGTSLATSPDGITWTTRTIPAGDYFGLAAGAAAAYFPSGEKVLATASGSSFTYAEAGGTGTVATSQTVTPLTGAFTDQVPSSFLGATIYTAPSQNGIAGSASQILGARDVATFRETLFFANITYPSSVDLYMLAVGGSAGIVNGDTITIDGLTYTAGASESISGRQFQAFTAGTPAKNIIDTSASLLRVLNRTLGNTVTARDVSDPNGVPGHLFLQESNGSTTSTVTFSRASSWAVANQRAPTQQKNELRWSQLQQPDVTPAFNSKRIGSADAAILRIIPTRSSLFILKEDGAWILSGYSAPWQIDPFDPTVQIIAPESAVVIDNQVYVLSHQGVLRISETGPSLISRPIEDLINAVLKTTMQPATASLAFAVADGHDHKFFLWLPTAPGDAQATQAYVYDTYTETWTRRTDAATGGVCDPVDDRIYLATPSGVKQERKTFTTADLADESYPLTVLSGTGSTLLNLADASAVRVGDAIGTPTLYGIVTGIAGNAVTLDRAAAVPGGAALGYRAISTAVEWTPKFGGGPGVVNHYQEVSAVFRHLYFAQASIGFASSLNPAWTDIQLAGSDYGFTGEAVPRFALRSLVDMEHARAPQLSVRWQHAQAFSPAEVEALSVLYRPLSVRLGR